MLQRYDPLTLCEYMGGSGQCSSVLAADYVPTAYFDKDDLARLTYLENESLFGRPRIA
jgi:hypothetical protein